ADDKVLFRFNVISDGHYGQPNTPFQDYFKTISDKINRYHEMFPSRFVVMNGDVFHDNPAFLQPAADALSSLKPKVYVTKGNHDMATKEAWEKVWGYPENHDFTMGSRAVLLGTTSNEKGTYLCPDTAWFADRLEKYKRKKE